MEVIRIESRATADFRQYEYCILKITSTFRINLPLFSIVVPSNSCCFCPVGLSLLIQHFQQVNTYSMMSSQDKMTPNQ